MMNRRHALSLLAAAPLLPTTQAFANDAWSPSRPISLVVPFAAGGPTDGFARAIAEKLPPLLGQPVVIDNRPGAGGSLANTFVARAAPDGHTLLMAGSSMVTAAALAKTPYDPVTSYTPVVPLLTLEMLLVVNADLPVRTVAELVKYAKANPGKLSYGSTGTGAITHMQMEMFKSMTGTHILHIPYRGSAPALMDLLAGNIQVCFDSLITAGPYIKNGKLRALALAMPERSLVTPEIPTFREAGLPDFEASAWTGLLGPAGMPRPIVDRIHQATVTALADPAVLRRVEAIGGRVTRSPTDVYAQRIATELPRWQKLVKDMGLKPD